MERKRGGERGSSTEAERESESLKKGQRDKAESNHQRLCGYRYGYDYEHSKGTDTATTQMRGEMEIEERERDIE